MPHRPIGIIGSDGPARAAAERVAATGQRVLLYVVGGVGAGKLPKNIEAAATPTDIGFDCDIVFSFINDSLLLRDLLIGTPERLGLGAEMNPGAVLVDFGVRPPRETQALLGITGTRGVAIVDAAVIDNGEALSSGTNSVLIGGYPDSVDLVEPALALLGRVDRTGPLGSAHTSAALMGYMEAAHRVAHDEAMSVGLALGLTSDTLERMLEQTAKRSSDGNIVRLAHRTGLALKLATDRGVSAEVIDFTGARLANGLVTRT
jgi:3-hydroxyisobutyrate dehydrogenase